MKPRYLLFSFFVVLFGLELAGQKSEDRSGIGLQLSRAENIFLEKNYLSASRACNPILNGKNATPDELIQISYIKSASELNLGNFFQASFYYYLAERIISLYEIDYPDKELLDLLDGQLKLKAQRGKYAETSFLRAKETIEKKLEASTDEKKKLLLMQRLALCLTNIGDYAANQEGDLNKALEFHKQAENLLLEIEKEKKGFNRVLEIEADWSKAMLYSNFANCYTILNQDSIAIDYLDEAMEIAEDRKFRVLKVDIGNKLGSIYETADTPNAKEIYRQNLDILEDAEELYTQRNEVQVKLMRLFLEGGSLDSLGLLLDAYDESPVVNDSLEIASARTVERVLTREIEEKLAVSRRNDYLLMVIIGALLFGLVGLLLGVLYFMIRTKNRQLRIAQAELQASELDLQQKNGALEQSNKDLVLSKREMNHRVKNTLQLIGSIVMSYQREDEVRESPVTSRVLGETRSKIEAILLLHNQLSGRRNNGEIILQDYLHNLVDYLKKTLLYTEANFFAEIEVQDVPPLHLEKAQNIGLAITELAINSYKYSPAEDKWIKVIATLPEKGTLHLIVEDNGKELAKKSISTSLGLKIIREIIKRQFKGQFIDPDGVPGKHTRFEVKIPIENLT